MTWWVALSGAISLLLLLLFLGIPIFVSFLILNLTGIALLFGTSGFGLFANSIYATATSGSLTAVPLFIAMGEILFKSGAMEVIFDALDRLVGRIRGRQYVVCILLSAILGALSGAAMAVAGLLGRSLFPAMRKRGYDTEFAAGTILAGASLDPIIPPSVLAVLVATAADVSIGKMLIAGVIPGLVLTGMFLIYVLIRVYFKPSLAPDIAIDAADRKTGSAVFALLAMVPSLFVFFMVMGLIMLGIATPTEAAATGVAGAIILAGYYRRLSMKLVVDAFYTAAVVASLLLIIMCTAVMFSQLLTVTGAAKALGEIVVHLNLSAAFMVFSMMAVPFVLFMFLDQVALMLVLVPIYKPIINVYGFDELWFWTLFLIVATVGGLTPPFGYVLFALKSAAPDVPIRIIYRASWPFVWIICVGMVVFALFPSLILFLPRLMGPH